MDDTGHLSLRDVQRWMKARIQPGTSPSARGGDTLLNPQRNTPGLQRLAVYAGGYLARTQQALAEVYEAVHHVLGPGTFAQLSQAYAQQHPSRDYNLSLVGRHLPAFLTTYVLTQRLPFLPDLARLEWLVCQAFHAAQQSPLAASQLPVAPLKVWERARLHFQPAVGLLTSAWPVLDIWQARTRPRAEINIDLVDRPQRVLVFREGVHVRCELVEAWQHALLEGLLAGWPLGEVCGALADQAPDGALPVTEWFARWAALGLIVRCEVPESVRTG